MFFYSLSSPLDPNKITTAEQTEYKLPEFLLRCHKSCPILLSSGLVPGKTFSVQTVLCVPTVTTGRPGQLLGERVAQIVQYPGEDYVIIYGQEGGSNNHAPSQACKVKKYTNNLIRAVYLPSAARGLLNYGGNM